MQCHETVTENYWFLNLEQNFWIIAVLLLKQTSEEWGGGVVWKGQNILWLLTFLLSLSLQDNVKAA